MYDGLTRSLLEALVIFAVGVLVGLSINYRLVMDAFGGKLQAPLPVATVGEPVNRYPAPVDLEGLRSELQGGALAVDARIPELFAEGHIPGAVSLPLADLDQDLPAFLDKVPRDRRIITYCNGYGCPDSFDLGVKLLAAGYTDVLVFEGGMPAWQDAGLPVAKEAAP